MFDGAAGARVGRASRSLRESLLRPPAARRGPLPDPKRIQTGLRWRAAPREERHKARPTRLFFPYAVWDRSAPAQGRTGGHG